MAADTAEQGGWYPPLLEAGSTSGTALCCATARESPYNSPAQVDSSTFPLTPPVLLWLGKMPFFTCQCPSMDNELYSHVLSFSEALDTFNPEAISAAPSSVTLVLRSTRKRICLHLG